MQKSNMKQVMQESPSLFSYLTSYVPTEKRESKEDFLTQAFAWVLKHFPQFAYHYIDFLRGKLSHNTAVSGGTQSIKSYEIDTQRQLDDGHSRLDLLIRVELIDGKKEYYICEHKVDSELSAGQISRYMALTSEIDDDAEAAFYSVLLTKSKNQHSQAANVSIVWGDIKELIDKFVSIFAVQDDNNAFVFLLGQLSQYLTEKGLENVKPIRKYDIETHNYNKFANDSEIEKSFNYIMRRLLNDLDTLKTQEDLEREFPNLNKLSEAYLDLQFSKAQWGRKGINIFGNQWDPNAGNKEVALGKGEWKVGLFVGVLLDPRDHKLEPYDKSKGFDMVVILDGRGKYNGKSLELNNPAFDKMTRALKCNSGDFDFVPFDKLRSSYRLAVLRIPFIDVLSENGVFQEDIDKQYELFKEYAFRGINLMADSYSE